MSEIGTLYRVGGKVEEVHPHNGRKFTLEELQEFVGGYIEHVPRTKPFAFCNEEGLLNNLPPNDKASEVFKWPGLRGDVIQVKRAKATKPGEQKVERQTQNSSGETGRVSMSGDDKFRVKHPHRAMWCTDMVDGSWADALDFVNRQKPEDIVGFRIQLNIRPQPKHAKAINAATAPKERTNP